MTFAIARIQPRSFGENEFRDDTLLLDTPLGILGLLEFRLEQQN